MRAQSRASVCSLRAKAGALVCPLEDTAKSSSHVEAVHVRNANMSGHAMYGPLLQSFQPEASIALHDKRHYVSPDITAAAGGACLCWRIGLQCPSQKVLL